MAADDAPESEEDQDVGAESDDASRRTFLNLGTGVLAAAAAATVVAPAAVYLTAPLRRGPAGEGGFIPTFDRTMFPSGEPVKVELVADQVDGWNAIHDVAIGAAWVVALEGELLALSTVCPHLGCAIDFDPGEGKFKCPCHASAFALDGTVEFGPSPRPLDRLDVRVEDRLVSIRYERFKTGIETKEPV